MLDKRLRLLLISIMSWQAVCLNASFHQDNEEFRETPFLGPKRYAVINIPGKEPFAADMQDNGALGVLIEEGKQYLKEVKNKFDSLQKEMARNVGSGIAKFKLVENDKSNYTVDFIKNKGTKIEGFPDDQATLLKIDQQIKDKSDKVDTALVNLNKQRKNPLNPLSWFEPENDEGKILSFLDEINEGLSVISKMYTTAKIIVDKVADSIALFDAEAAKDKADEAARKATADKQEAEKVAAVAPNKTNKVAAEKAAREVEKAARDAVGAEKVAIQASVKLNENRSTIFEKNIAQNIQQIAQLRELMEGLLGRIDNLLKGIESDSSRYSAKFIQDIGNKFKPDRDRIFKGFNSVITDIDNVLNVIKESNKNKKALEAKISETSNLIEKSEMDDEISKIVLTLGQLSNSSSNALKIAEKYQRELSELFTALLTEGQKSRKVYPAEVGRVLELSHVVRLEKNKMDMKGEARRRVEMQRKEDAVARVLNLFVAVKDQKAVVNKKSNK
ncbi:hypothetical protein HYV10_02505 [Candidatus Dependentiae bacterium]|nr:hypothetical protein [Candidatus Dependentiae bacterium]